MHEDFTASLQRPHCAAGHSSPWQPRHVGSSWPPWLRGSPPWRRSAARPRGSLPNVKSLIADQGVTFDNSFVSYSLCCPSRSTFLTGQYAHNHGVWGNAAPSGGYYKLDSTNTLPVWLQRAGYQTIHLGKYLNQYGTRNPREIPPGWGQWYGTPDPSTYRYLDYTINENGNLVQFGTAAGDYKTDVESRLAVDLIARQATDPRPFFMWVAFVAPHSGAPRDADDPTGLATPSPAPRDKDHFANEPLPMPPSFNEADVSDKPLAIRRRPLLNEREIAAIRENWQQRRETLLAVDEAVGSIVETLREAGELDNTLILFTSDNGFFHGEHRIANGKVLWYEPSIRLPLLLRWTGNKSLPRGVHRAAPPVGPRHPARDAHIRGCPLSELALRGARDRREGAVQPRAGPGRAEQPPDEPELRPDGGEPRRPPRTSAPVQGRGVPPRPSAVTWSPGSAPRHVPFVAGGRPSGRTFVAPGFEHGLLPRRAPPQA
ncbi:MAG: hypothetical protein E6G31_00735 [Actinobacteria bacterium]|nr:MAG: hypothetical protein E6G31_00735 [Actinomycetota bacterium]